MPTMIEAMRGVANMIRSVGQEADAAAKAARDATKDFRSFREEVEEAIATASSMEVAGSESTGGMGSSTGDTAVTSKGMAKAIATARRTL